MIKTSRGFIEVGYTVGKGEPNPETEEEKRAAIHSEMKADLFVIMRGISTMFGDEETLKIVIAAAEQFVNG